MTLSIRLFNIRMRVAASKLKMATVALSAIALVAMALAAPTVLVLVPFALVIVRAGMTFYSGSATITVASPAASPVEVTRRAKKATVLLAGIALTRTATVLTYLFLGALSHNLVLAVLMGILAGLNISPAASEWRNLSK